MQTFISDQASYRAKDIQSGQVGALTLCTRTSVRGNYRKGPVPVTVHFEYRFDPDEAYWERNAEHPADDPYPVAHLKQFDSASEREMFLSSHYERL